MRKGKIGSIISTIGNDGIGQTFSQYNMKERAHNDLE